MELSYRLIDMTSHRSEEEVQLVNTCFQHWYGIFSQDVEARGATLNKDEFHRAKILAVLQSGDAVAGFHLYSMFDLREQPSLAHSYLKALPDAAKSLMLDRGVHSVMAMEYLTVTPEYRSKEYAGVKIAELVIRLGLHVLSDLGLDSALGVARADRKVNTLGDSIGFEEIALMEKYNNKCNLMLFDRKRCELLGNPFTLKAVENLWNQRHQSGRVRKPAAA